MCGHWEPLHNHMMGIFVTPFSQMEKVRQEEVQYFAKVRAAPHRSVQITPDSEADHCALGRGWCVLKLEAGKVTEGGVVSPFGKKKKKFQKLYI